jgi:ATP-dependent helicase HrpA
MTPTDFKLDELPTNLRITYKLLSEKKVLGVSLSLDELKQKFDPAFIKQESKAKVSLVIDTEAVQRRSEFVAEVISRVVSPAAFFADAITKDQKQSILAVGYRNVAAFVEDVVLALVQEQVDSSNFTSLNAEQMAKEVEEKVILECNRCVDLVSEIAPLVREASKAISSIQDIGMLFVLANQKKHLAQLVPAKLVSSTGLKQLERVPLYIRANQLRTTSLLNNPERDRRLEIELNEAILLFENAGGSLPLRPEFPERVIQARWLIEEFRLSLFAPELGVPEPVSLESIKKCLNSK